LYFFEAQIHSSANREAFVEASSVGGAAAAARRAPR